jgi:hypothetical protein
VFGLWEGGQRRGEIETLSRGRNKSRQSAAAGMNARNGATPHLTRRNQSSLEWGQAMRGKRMSRVGASCPCQGQPRCYLLSPKHQKPVSCERYSNRTLFFIMPWHRIVSCEPTAWPVLFLPAHRLWPAVRALESNDGVDG